MSTTVEDLMTKAVVFLTEGDELPDAQEMMELIRIRHLPVCRGKRLVGMITHRDLLRAQAQIVSKLMQRTNDDDCLISIGVDTVLNRDVRTVTPTTSAKEAACIMLEEKYGALPVVDGGELVGIITEADFLKWAIKAMNA